MKDQINTIRAALDMANLGIEDGVATQKALTALSELEAMAGKQEPVALLVRKKEWHKDMWDCAPPGNPDYGRMWASERMFVYASPLAQQYEASDMASAAADGFRSGVASVQQGEPVAWLYESPMPDGSVFAGASAERLKIGIGVTPDSKEHPLYRAAPVAQQQCTCGQPSLGVVHRADGPCFVYEPPTQQPQAEAVPPGFVLVPVEPTPEMLGAGLRHVNGMASMPAAWRAMIAEAQKAAAAPSRAAEDYEQTLWHAGR